MFDRCQRMRQQALFQCQLMPQPDWWILLRVRPWLDGAELRHQYQRLQGPVPEWGNLQGFGKQLSLRVPPWLHRRALREGHRRVLELAVSERRALSGRSERLPVPVSGWLLRKSLPAGYRLLLAQPVSEWSALFQPGHRLLLRLPGGLRGQKLLSPQRPLSHHHV